MSTQDNVLNTIGKEVPPVINNRDAIHMAIIPVEVAETSDQLVPGEHVCYEGGYISNQGSLRVGIVDPFRTRVAHPGCRVWLFLYPKSIQDMRHCWSHPYIPDEAQNEHTASDEMYAQSKKWLEDFCEDEYLEWDELIFAMTKIANGESDCLPFERPDDYTYSEFAMHFAVITCKQLPPVDNGWYSFRCAC